jgi:hypothetical protein
VNRSKRSKGITSRHLKTTEDAKVAAVVRLANDAQMSKEREREKACCYSAKSPMPDSKIVVEEEGEGEEEVARGGGRPAELTFLSHA